MSAVTEASGSAPSRFAETLTDLLDRVQYRRVSPANQFDPVYALRYAAYRRENFIPVNSEEITRDAYDTAANCYCYGVYIDDTLVSSLRLHIATATDPTSPSRAIWPEILGGIIAGGSSYIDPSRFTADRDASLAFPALPYLTLRIAFMACKHFQATYCLSSVRPEHAAFYKRVFGSTQLAGEGFWGELSFPVCLYATYLPITYARIIERYPFFLSTEQERADLFGPEGKLTPAITPTARMARRLQLIQADAAATA